MSGTRGIVKVAVMVPQWSSHQGLQFIPDHKSMTLFIYFLPLVGGRQWRQRRPPRNQLGFLLVPEDGVRNLGLIKPTSSTTSGGKVEVEGR